MTTVVDLDSLSLHPDAAQVPMPDPSDLRALRASLEENGQQDPLHVTDNGVILDGRTRWTLLRDLGAQTVRVEVVSVPAHQQTGYIIDRALARRHLSMAQKKALNHLLRSQVVETRTPSLTTSDRGRPEPIRIGYSQTQRAEKLGVDLASVKRWDDEPLDSADAPTRPVPTHAIDRRGRPQPLHKNVTPRADRGLPPTARPERPEPLRKSRPIPAWSRQFTGWCRSSARPEDRDFLRRLDRELHAALDRNGIACAKEAAS